MTLPPLAVILAPFAFIAIGWGMHVAWLRARIFVEDRPDGRVQIRIGRAVAGTWPNRRLARANAERIKRQIGGKS